MEYFTAHSKEVIEELKKKINGIDLYRFDEYGAVYIFCSDKNYYVYMFSLNGRSKRKWCADYLNLIS